MTMKNEPRPIREVLSEYQMMVGHHWRLIVITTCLLAGILSVVVYLLPNVYQATTTIIVYPQKVPEKYVAAPVTEASDERLNMLTQEVLSASRLQEIIDRLELYPNLRAKMGREEVIANMRRNIHIQVKHSGGSGASSAFTLSFDASTPQQAALVANQLAESFIRWNLRARMQQVEGTTAFIDSELDQARQELQQQDDRLRNYRLRYIGEMPDQMQANMQALGQLQIQLQNNADELSRLDEKRLVLDQLPEADNTLKIPSGASQRTELLSQINAEKIKLAALKSRYTDEYPDVIAAEQQLQQMNNQLAALPHSSQQTQASTGDSVGALRAALLAREHNRLLQEQAFIKQKIASYQAKVDAVPIRQEELSDLTRDYQTSKEHYNSLLEKSYAAQMATQLEQQQQAERFSVLDPAQPPERPIRPNRPLLWFASFMISLVAGFGMAMIRERSDLSVKSEAELARLVPRGVEMLGVIPRIEHSKGVVTQQLMRVTP